MLVGEDNSKIFAVAQLSRIKPKSVLSAGHPLQAADSPPTAQTLVAAQAELYWESFVEMATRIASEPGLYQHYLCACQGRPLFLSRRYQPHQL